MSIKSKTSVLTASAAFLVHAASALGAPSPVDLSTTVAGKLVYSNGWTQTTDGDGDVTIANLPQGYSMGLDVMDDSRFTHPRWTSDVQLARSPVTSETTLHLIPASTLSGTVSCAAAKTPAAGVQVLAKEADLSFRLVGLHRHHGNLWTADAAYPVFLPSTPVAILANREIRREMRKEFQEFVASGPDTSGSSAALTYSAEPVVTLARPDLISVYFNAYEFEGGAHGQPFYTTFNFGLVGGKASVLTLQSLCSKGHSARKDIAPLVIKALRSQDGAEWVQDGTVTASTKGFVDGFYLTPAAINFVFAPYDVGPYAAGSFWVKIPYRKINLSLDRSGPLKALPVQIND